MKTTKKLIILCLTAVMAVFAVMPSTFSWYSHSGTVRDTGNTIRLFDSSSSSPLSLPLSLKQQSGSTVAMTTYEADEYGTKGNQASFSGTCVPAKSGNNTGTKNYITTFRNTGTKDVYIDFNMTSLTNSANAFVGVKSPVVNERNFASRSSVKTALYDKIRIYFEDRAIYSWWDTKHETNPENYYPLAPGLDGDTWCDMNIQYYSPSESQHIQTYMDTASGTDEAGVGDHHSVYYKDIDASSDYLFFFNNYYLWSGSLKPNQTPNYMPAKHTVYYFVGEDQDEKRKCNTYSSYDLLSLNSYYESVTMPAGGTARIGLTRGTSDSDEDYNYTANVNATYNVTQGSRYITVSRDGLITAKSDSSGGTATVETTLTGKFGDELTLTTTVNIPELISQVPIAQNIKIPAGEEVDVEWYLKNTGSSPVGFANVFCTL